MNIVGEIKLFLGDDYAQLKYSESKNSFSIDIVMVPVRYRNKGIGTSLINHIFLMAEGLGKDVRVSARPIGSVSEEKLQRLVTYYQRLGFKAFDRGLTTVYMIRNIKQREVVSSV